MSNKLIDMINGSEFDLVVTDLSLDDFNNGDKTVKNSLVISETSDSSDENRIYQILFADKYGYVFPLSAPYNIDIDITSHKAKTEQNKDITKELRTSINNLSNDMLALRSRLSTLEKSTSDLHNDTNAQISTLKQKMDYDIKRDIDNIVMTTLRTISASKYVTETTFIQKSNELGTKYNELKNYIDTKIRSLEYETNNNMTTLASQIKGVTYTSIKDITGKISSIAYKVSTLSVYDINGSYTFVSRNELTYELSNINNEVSGLKGYVEGRTIPQRFSDLIDDMDLVSHQYLSDSLNSINSSIKSESNDRKTKFTELEGKVVNRFAVTPTNSDIVRRATDLLDYSYLMTEANIGERIESISNDKLSEYVKTSIFETKLRDYATKTDALGYADVAENNAKTYTHRRFDDLKDIAYAYTGFTNQKIADIETKQKEFITGNVLAGFDYATKSEAKGFADTAENNAYTRTYNQLITDTETKLKDYTKSDELNIKDINGYQAYIVSPISRLTTQFASLGLSVSENYALKTSVPTKMSELENDKGYVSADYVDEELIDTFNSAVDAASYIEVRMSDYVDEVSGKLYSYIQNPSTAYKHKYYTLSNLTRPTSAASIKNIYKTNYSVALTTVYGKQFNAGEYEGSYDAWEP